MAVARVAAGMLKHFEQLGRVWGNKEVIHVKITEEIDELGNIIDQSRSTSTIYGIVSPANFKGNAQPIGYLQPGDLTAFFLYSDDIIISNKLTELTTRHDHIIYEENEYQVYNVEYAYDVKTSQVEHEPIFGNYLLRRIIYD